MCGIAGIWGSENAPIVNEMNNRLSHRGPDAEGLYRCPHGYGTLGHRRLSIMDPEGGDQPLYNEDQSLAIVANGEIYNFPTLRQQLAAEHILRTDNDSEAILHFTKTINKTSSTTLMACLRSQLPMVKTYSPHATRSASNHCIMAKRKGFSTSPRN